MKPKTRKLLKTLALRIANRSAIALGALALGVMLLFALLKVYDFYNKWLQRPSEREAIYIKRLHEQATYGDVPFLLSKITPWPWDKACLDYTGYGLNVKVDMETYATPDTYDFDDPRAAIVFFVKGQKPWGIRIPAKYLPNIEFGNCIDNTFVIKSN